jgi:hypothetical protein
MAASMAGTRDGQHYESNSLARTVACPALPQSPDATVKLDAQAGPVVGSPPTGAEKTVTVFLLVPTGGGSTALLSLLASSPEVSTLCSAGTWACEGTWLLIDNGIIQNKASRWNPSQPSDWSEALEVYETAWDPEKKIRVDKSPPNLAKISAISQHFWDKPDEVAFISMTMSFCYRDRSFLQQETGLTDRQMKGMIADGLEALDQRFARLTLKYEDLVRDPYSEARRILDFLPALKSLDPAVNNLGINKTSRNQSIVEYLLNQGPFDNRVAHVTEEMKLIDERLGYQYW